MRQRVDASTRRRVDESKHRRVDVDLVAEEVARRAARGGRRGLDGGPGLGPRVVDGAEGFCCLDDRGVDVGGGVHFVWLQFLWCWSCERACKFRGGLTGNKTVRDSRPTRVVARERSRAAVLSAANARPPFR